MTRALTRRPALWVELGVVVSWIALAVASSAAQGSEGAGSGDFWSQGPLWVCQLGMGGMAGHGGGSVAGGGAPDVGGLLAAAPMWALMAGAMMVPPALPSVRHVAGNSLYWRRRRAAGEFLLAFLAVWTAFSVVVLGALSGWSATGTRWAPAVALAAAAAWQLTPFKERALRACHRLYPLPPRGWRATVGAARFGWREGLACLASCWAMMLAVAVAGPGSLPWMGAMTGVVAVEKLADKPVRTARWVAALLAAGAAGLLLFP
jgi:predicted metal-binding membrane protein